jgi:hypothetical protein
MTVLAKVKISAPRSSAIPAQHLNIAKIVSAKAPSIKASLSSLPHIKVPKAAALKIPKIKKITIIKSIIKKS